MLTELLAVWALGSCALAIRAGVRRAANERATFFVLFWPLVLAAVCVLGPLYLLYALGRLASGAGA